MIPDPALAVCAAVLLGLGMWRMRSATDTTSVYAGISAVMVGTALAGIWSVLYLSS